MRRFLAVTVLLLLFSQCVVAQDRHALLIGNKTYTTSVGTLVNPHNDTNVVATALKSIGFERQTRLLDLRRHQVLSAVRNYATRLASSGPGAIGFLYYSGHGAAEEGSNVNYLIPVDVPEPADDSFWDASVKLEDILKILQDRAPRAVHFVVFDACRNELKLPEKSATKGLAPIQAPDGMYVAFSSQFRRTASDAGTGGGPYARALAGEIVKPGLSHLDLFQNIQEAVARETGNKQRPNAFGELSHRMYLAGPERTSAPAPPSTAGPASPSASAGLTPADDWRACREIGQMTSLSMLAIAERRHSGTTIAECVATRIAELKERRAASTISGNAPSQSSSPPTRPSEARTAVELPIDECDRLASDGSDPERVTAPSETIPIGAIAACEIAVRANPESRRFAFQLGVALATHNRLRDAMPWYRKAAAAGHAEAMHKLGHALKNGKNGVAINLAEAAEWFRKSAELGQGAPARDYALMLQAGTGVAKDTVGAVKWLRRGAELGDAASMTLYAGELDEGRTVAKNPVEAMQWYRRAIDNGDTDAFWPLAVILEEGRGTRRDFVEAAFLIYRALQKGDAHSFEQMTTNATNWDVEFRRELQKLLKRDGHYSGPLDGSFGGSTQAALKKVFKADP